MKNNEIHKTVQSDFLKNVSEILLQARKNAKTAVNLSMVYAYYEIGRMIVEEEQHGANRAAYGKQLLKELSAYLTDIFGKGFSTTNLKQMRQFYLTYVNDQISQTLSDQFETLPTASTGRKFFLSWSHYLKLMRIDNIDERHFYEIECVKNDWSLSELKRQYNSALYERIALSTDKDKVYRLAVEGQKVETPKDAVKDPYVLEFLGLKELPEYSESELESRIIDHLQQFLLELGTGFAFIGRQVRFTFDEEHFLVEIVGIDKVVAGIVRRVNVNHLHLAEITFLQKLQHFQIVTLNVEIFSGIPVFAFFFAGAQRFANRFVGFHDGSLLAHPCKLIPLVAVHHIGRKHLLQQLKIDCTLELAVFIHRFGNAVRE